MMKADKNMNRDGDGDSNHDQEQQEHQRPQSWVRGVNLGGWLLMERYITPYQFAITTCHVAGDFCWYPGQINAPPTTTNNATTLCDLTKCQPLLSTNVFGQRDFPLDEYTLWNSFSNATIAEEWLNYHLEYFITETDIRAIHQAGVTHVRVPMAHWILYSRNNTNGWIVGRRWEAFGRLVQWCRFYGIQVWPDIHTAPGSQNGFDNSGHQSTNITCGGWIDHPDHVQELLHDVIQTIAQRIMDDGMRDVVTGFGILNEPFKDCHRPTYLSFSEQGLDLVRRIMGEETVVYVSDLFQPESFNDGQWWLDPQRYHDTFLDSHYYHVFSTSSREISPRQHIALTCQNEYHHVNPQKKLPTTQGGIATCCWQDAGNNTRPSNGGVQRMVGEWSVAVDSLPVDLLYLVMQSIAVNGTVLFLNRTMEPERQAFLRNFAKAQMVVYEAADHPFISGAWFYWTAKMEGGAFAEWDFLRGIREGWIPPIPHDDTISSASLYGTCYDIMARTDDDWSILHEFPEPQMVPKKKHQKQQQQKQDDLDDTTTLNDNTDDDWQFMALDDDVVVSHGDSISLHEMVVPTMDDDDESASTSSAVHDQGKWSFRPSTTDASMVHATNRERNPPCAIKNDLGGMLQWKGSGLFGDKMIIIIIGVMVGMVISKWYRRRRSHSQRVGYTTLP